MYSLKYVPIVNPNPLQLQIFFDFDLSSSEMTR
jgi:hypothetical protein